MLLCGQARSGCLRTSGGPLCRSFLPYAEPSKVSTDLTVDQALKRVRSWRRSAERAEEARQKAVDELYAAVRAAVEAGVPIAQVAREAGLSRQGVYNVLPKKNR